MISVCRSLIRQFRSLLRRSVLLHLPKGSPLPIVFQAGRDGVTIFASYEGVTLSCQSTGRYESEVIALPIHALEQFESKSRDTVTIETSRSGGITTRWDDGGVPRVAEFEAIKADKLPTLPELPGDSIRCDASFLTALDEAMHTAAVDSVRRATNRAQLRGQAGEIIGTDGHHLLVQSGFQLPFTEDVLIPRVLLFGCKELSQEDAITIGKTKDHVCIQAGFWAVHLRIDTEGRYPDIRSIIPRPVRDSTRLSIAEEDAAFLLRTLPRLPGEKMENSPITVDLNGQAVIRSKGEEQASTTALTLARSTVTGRATQINTNRTFLARALWLGFREVTVINPDTPVLCEDRTRKYVWMVLDKKSAIAASKDAIHVSSPAGDSESTRVSGNGKPNTESANGNDEAIPVVESAPARPAKRKAAAASSNGQETNGKTQDHEQRGDHGELFAQVEALKTVLRDAYTKTHHIQAAIRKQQKQSKALKSTLASLRQLQQLSA